MLEPLRLGAARGLAPRGLRWPGSFVLLLLVLGFAGVAQAGPAKPAAQPVKPAAQPTAQPVKPATQPAKPATQPAKPTADPSAAASAQPTGKGTTDPFSDVSAGAAGTTPPDGANARQSDLYGARLDNLQTEVDELKDKIFRSKARLTLLKETVLRGVLAGSRVTITHQNLMSAGFKLTRVVYEMDGAQIFARTDETGSLDGEDEFVVYNGPLPPGPHTLSVRLVYKGNGYGVFSYLNGLTFESRSSHAFTAPENSAVKVISQGFERGNMTTEMKDRPAVNWQELPLDAAGRPMAKTRADKGASSKDGQ